MNLRKDHYHTYTECGARCTTQSAVPGVRAGSHGGARVRHLHTPAIRLTLCAARAAHNPFSRFSRFATSFIHNYRWCVCVVARETCVLRMDSERERPHTYLYIYNDNTSKKTFSGGCLGSRNDEERSEMRYVMRIAEFSESSNL